MVRVGVKMFKSKGHHSGCLAAAAAFRPRCSGVGTEPPQLFLSNICVLCPREEQLISHPPKQRWPYSGIITIAVQP